MKKSSLIITRRGQDIAAIIAREFGIPAIVGCSEAMDIPDMTEVTEAVRRRHRLCVLGIGSYEIEEFSIDENEVLNTKIVECGFSHQVTADSNYRSMVLA